MNPALDLKRTDVTLERKAIELLANVSHELRTPLNSLLVLAKLLSDNPERNLSKKQVEYAKTIYASSGDLLALINEILDLAKIESGRSPVEPREVALTEILAFVDQSFRPLAELKGLAFKIDVDVDLPARIHTDPRRLQRILTNLLANALKFTARGSVTLRVHRPRAAPRSANEPPCDSGGVDFSVVDTGIGIARNKQQLLFEAFQQADETTSRQYGGTGLGLWMSREIARLLGGEIRAESEVGKGSVFTLHLPERHVAATETLAAASDRGPQRDGEAAERRSLENRRRLLDAMPLCIWAADAGGQVNYWNRPGLSYCGLTPADIREESIWECLHPDDRIDARAHWEAGLRSGAPFERQVRIRRAADASYRWHLVRAVPERETDGTIVAWIATATDIDDQKRAEEALRKAIILRDDFLSVASHELRTPLTSLKLEVANLSRIARRDATESAPRLIAKVEKIDSQAARLHRLIDELLDVSRIAAGRLELHVETVDLAQIVSEVGARFSDEAARVGSTLNVHAPTAVVGRWDKSRLDQVVTNLVSNAIKYGDCKPIDVDVEGGNDRAIITIRDRGLGIAENDHERIFGRFERAASSRHYGGIGLGLWIVKQIIDALGGTVAVESTPGDGSTFKVELPLHADKTRRPAPAAGVDRARAASAQQQS